MPSGAGAARVSATAAAAPRLIAITDLERLPLAELVARFARLAQQAAAGSVALLLRDHARAIRERLLLGEALAKIAEDHGQELWVADRLDLALLLGARGAHLGEASVNAQDARRWLGEGVRITRAWHDLTLPPHAEQELGEVDALLLSPLLSPRKGRSALGLEALTALPGRLRARGFGGGIYALGGVTAESAAACLAAGALGVAAIGAVLEGDPAPLLSALGISRSRSGSGP